MIVFIALSLPACERKFPGFVRRYNKRYDSQSARDEALHNFCVHYNFSVSHPHNNLQINEISDLAFPPISGYVAHPKKLHSFSNFRNTASNFVSKARASSAAGESTLPFTQEELEEYNRDASVNALVKAVCTRKINSFDSLSNFTAADVFNGTLPESMDLRKAGMLQKPYDQGTCGSCYAQSTRFVLHSLFMHDIWYYKHDARYSEAFKNLNNRDLLFSVQFILNYTYGNSNSFCSGGNFAAVANDQAYFIIPSLEYEKDYPYYSMMESDQEPPAVEPPREDPVSDFSLAAPLNPIHWYYDEDRDNCPLSVIDIDLKGDKEHTMLKSFLARGIAVSGHEQIPEDTMGQLKYSMLKDSILTDDDYPCDTEQSNHQITFVGYGRYKGVKVLVIQNSWGASWGVHGTAYIKEDSNALCSLIDAEAVLPRYFRFNDELEPLNVPFNESQLYKNAVNEGLIHDIYSQVKWRYSGLDAAEGEKFVNNKLAMNAWIVLGLIALMAVVLLVFICRCLTRPVRNDVKHPIYMLLREQEGEFIPWDKGQACNNAPDAEPATK